MQPPGCPPRNQNCTQCAQMIPEDRPFQQDAFAPHPRDGVRVRLASCDPGKTCAQGTGRRERAKSFTRGLPKGSGAPPGSAPQACPEGFTLFLRAVPCPQALPKMHFFHFFAILCFTFGVAKCVMMSSKGTECQKIPPQCQSKRRFAPGLSSPCSGVPTIVWTRNGA